MINDMILVATRTDLEQPGETVLKFNFLEVHLIFDLC